MPKVAKVPKAKAARAQKDPNAPKKNLSSFMIFSQQQRLAIKEANPKATFGKIHPLLVHLPLSFLSGELGKLLGAEWKSLSEKEKAPYVELADKEKARYLVEKAEYDETAPEANSSSSPKKPAKRVAKKKAKQESEDEKSESDSESEDDE